ncbi:hypothetical protein BOTBODRAFT_611381 [Botryobasidium botryosum FD-172 SS1]|uniref:Uncharacterized protein n=1 Tax=Botryobasidium botryosum (strain FD-172 SS1) TaxID=930990 RepID=A0A067M691_BOTB1|nr:hypothetical protein BOTBODRAFT_611381 [Botryobasidium botryosum FD-172 SS1]
MAGPTLQIFWPSDVEIISGFFFGWRSSPTAIAVAGILKSSTLDLAGRHLHRVVASKEWGDPKGLCRMDPLILGKCSKARDGRSSAPTLEFSAAQLDSITENMALEFLFYRRPSLRMMRYFSLDPLQLDITTAKNAETVTEQGSPLSSRMKALHHADFTRPHARPTGIVTTVNHVNPQAQQAR